MAKQIPIRRKVLHAVLAATLVFLVVEGLASVLFAARDVLGASGATEESHCDYDADLGWSNRPDVHIADLYGDGTPYTTNSQGFRSTDGDYTPQIPEGRYRVVCVGDSFTMGHGVGDADTYPAQLQAVCPQLQTVNMGLGGYGIDQAYLWYLRDGVALDADLVVFAFIANDFQRMASDEFLSYGKPILRIEAGALTVGNVPVPETWGSSRPFWRIAEFASGLSLGRIAGRLLRGSNDSAADPKMNPELAKVVGHVFTELQRVCAERQQHLALVYLPTPPQLAKEPTPEARWAEEFASSNGIPFVNLTADFEKLPPRKIATTHLGNRPVPGAIARRGHQPINPHYSPSGNRFVAEALLGHLRRLFANIPR